LDKKQVRAWVLFDFANSVFPAVIVSLVFQRFYVQLVVGNELGNGTRWWGAALSTSALIVALSAPVLGAIADRAGVRKRLMAAYVAACVLGVLSFSVLGPGAVVLGFALFVLANVGFEGCLVFYNAYLADIVPVEKQGWVSGLGFAVGYVGSVLGLVLALVLLTALDSSYTLVWVMVATLFTVFSLPSFFLLPKDREAEMSVREAAVWGLTSFRELWGEVIKQKELRRFLLAYFIYIDGVLTAYGMAATLAETTFGFTQNELILLILAIQFTALFGALVLAKPTDRIGPKKVLTGVLVLWVGAAVSIYFVTSKPAFAVLALIAGFGLGAAQSVSRAYMSSLIPRGRESEMFGFYALCGRSSSVIGPMVFGQVAFLTGGNQRLAVAAITVLFVAGLALLQRVDDPKARRVVAA
jgi:UMF1 family MFS transporter